ncbi:MAG TPA: winged helix-turn-helix domain-containing protein [Candidatus Thermoplasmatota archaeon]|nr:winged helix-turn-helix domain-containing protein [Candidatus Thermoplasmatota archaeon]
MLEDALGSRSKVRILRELVRRGGAEITTDDLVKATGQSTGTLVPALQQLAASGVVLTRMEGRTRVFSLSPRHPATPLLRRLFTDETVALHAAADALFRRAHVPGARFAAWYLDAGPEDDRRHAAWMLVVADDALAAEAAIRKAVQGEPLGVRVVGVEEARKLLAAGDPGLERGIRRGRVVFADRGWLTGA